MNKKKNATIAICLTAILAFSPLAGFAQAATTFSGEAVALRANALGISASVSDTGPLPSSGGNTENTFTRAKYSCLGPGDRLESTPGGTRAWRTITQSLWDPKHLVGSFSTIYLKATP